MSSIFSALWTGTRRRKRVESPRRRPRSTVILEVEELEDRTAPSAVPVGPSPLFNEPASSSILHGAGQLGSRNQFLGGRVTDMAIIADFDGLGQGHQAMLLGAASGGVWWSSNFASANPTWVPRTDFVGLPVQFATGHGSGANNVGSIAVDPYDPRVIYVGTGEAHASNSGSGTGINNAKAQ